MLFVYVGDSSNSTPYVTQTEMELSWGLRVEDAEEKPGWGWSVDAEGRCIVGLVF